jgi:AraC-like DNA-binding protein
MDLYIKIIYALPVYQSVILAFLLFLNSSRQQGYSKFIMGVFQLLIAFYYTFNFLYSIKAFEVVSLIYMFILPVILAFVPIFYIYLLSITTAGFAFRKKHLWHFAPSFIILVLNLPYLFLTVTERISYISSGYYKETSTHLLGYIFFIYISVIYGICIVQLAVYYFRALKLYNRHKTYIENHYSYTENINLRWILALLVCFISFFVINDLLYIVGFRHQLLSQFIYNFSMLGISLFAGYHGLIQKDIGKVQEAIPIPGIKSDKTEITETGFYEEASRNNETDGKEASTFGKIYTAIKAEILPVEKEPASPAEKYSGSALSEGLRELLILKLEKIMNDDKIFIKDSLTVEDVANELGTRTKYISQIINENYQKNFYNFINTYRVEEAMRLLTVAENDKYSILGIAQMVGFVSKSTFNAAFKRVAGTTPSEYRRRNSSLPD